MAVEELTPQQQAQGAANRVGAMFRNQHGMQAIYNRLAQPFEKSFDGRRYTFGPHETLILPDDIAIFLYRTSVVSYEPITGVAVRALVTADDETFELPYEQPLGPELLDRSVSDNYVQRGTDGVPTKARPVPVRGGGYDQGRKISPESRV